MSKVDWSLAPEGATSFVGGNWPWRKVECDIEYYWPVCLYEWCKLPIIQLKQPKPWSGPEDGLPPVGMRVMVHDCSHDYTKKFNGQIVRIVAHDRGDCAVFAADRFIYHALIAEKFKLPPTAEQLAADKRETAIREIMDIAQVDCRVTAARLVDAGFKREVV